MAGIGLEQYLLMDGDPPSPSPPPRAGLKVNEKLVALLTTNTGKSSSALPDLSDLPRSKALFQDGDTMRRRGRLLPMNTSGNNVFTLGKMTPVSSAVDLSWVPSLLEETTPTTGNSSSLTPKMGNLMKSPQTSLCGVILLYEEYEPIMRLLKRLSEQSMFSGVVPVLVNPEELGQKLGWMLILKLPAQSGGMGTRAISTWCLTNSEERLVLDTSFAGLIGTRYLLKQKEVVPYSKLHLFGLQAIYHPMLGIPN